MTIKDEYMSKHPRDREHEYYCPSKTYTNLVLAELDGLDVKVDDAWCDELDEPGEHGGPTITVSHEDTDGELLGRIEYTWIAKEQAWHRVHAGSSYGIGWMLPDELAAIIGRDRIRG